MAMAGLRLPFAVVLVGAVLAFAALGLVVRFSVIQAPSMGWLCQSAEAPWFCGPRQGLVLLIRSGGLGYVAVALGLAALLAGGRGLVMVAAVVGAFGGVLHNPDLAIAGVLMASLRALRV